MYDSNQLNLFPVQVVVILEVIRSYSKEPKTVTSFSVNSHSFMQTLTNHKSRTVSSWLLIG